MAPPTRATGAMIDITEEKNMLVRVAAGARGRGGLRPRGPPGGKTGAGSEDYPGAGREGSASRSDRRHNGPRGRQSPSWIVVLDPDRIDRCVAYFCLSAIPAAPRQLPWIVSRSLPSMKHYRRTHRQTFQRSGVAQIYRNRGTFRFSTIGPYRFSEMRASTGMIISFFAGDRPDCPGGGAIAGIVGPVCQSCS